MNYRAKDPENQQREVYMIDINKFLQVLSEILSDKYGAQVTITATPKKEMKK